MKRPPSNVAHSVKARLQAVSKAQGEEFNYVLVRYALERLLERLSRSPHRGAFILKGAMLFRMWSPETHRPTKDLDLLGRGSPEPARLAAVFAEICNVPVEDDGMVFDSKSVKAARIKGDAEYEGVRITLVATLGTARLPLQVDVGFGDAVTPPAIEVDFPTLLPMPLLKLRAYQRETVVAEKLHAMVDLGLANSRMKDFFDIWFLSQNFGFDGPVLSESIRATFEKRGTPLPGATPMALTEAFALNDGKQKQWKGFSSRLAQGTKSKPLHEVVAVIAPFVVPVLDALREKEPFARTWTAGGPWT